MSQSPRLVTPSLILGAIMAAAPSPGADSPKPDRRPLDPATVARRPAPGTTVPGGFTFTADGGALTYLKSESSGLDRVLWRAEVREGGGPPRVVARPPGVGDTDANVSKEEALRRERLRQVDTGITSVALAAKSDLAVIPLNGDLYIQRGVGPLERLTDTPAPEIDPKPSDDGTKVAFVRERELYVIDLASKKETQLSTGAIEGVSHGLAEFMAQEEMDRFAGFWWSPDGATIAYQETDERHIPHFTISHDGAETPSVETHRYPFAGAANARVRLGLVAASGGPTRWLDFDEPGREVYLARVDWESPRSLLVQRLERGQKTLRLVRVDARNAQTSVLIEESADAWVNLHQDLRPVPGTGEFVWASEKSGFKHLELRDKDGDLVHSLTEGNWSVDSVAGLDVKRREVWFTSGKDGPLGAKLYRVSLDGGPVVPVTPEPGTHKSVVALDGNSFVDTYSSLTRPPVTTLRDRDGKTIAGLDDASVDPKLSEVSLTPPELVSFTNRDGLTLHGALYRPKSKEMGEKAPVVVMLYGGPHVQYVTDSWTMTADLRARYLAERGFAVWKMDNRGSARRGLAFESALYRDMGSVEVRDQVDGVKFLANRFPEIDVSRVGVNGRSYGGYLTLRCLTEAPDTFHAGVAEAPVTSWDGYDTCYTERYMETPLANPEGYRRSSVLTRVPYLRGKLLVIHGLIDENVHFRHTARLISALVAAGKSFEVLPIPEERHSSRKASNRTAEVDRMARFFESALAVPPR